MSTVKAASGARSNGTLDSRNTPAQIKRSDRLFIVGATGSGKTTKATIMLARLPWVVVLDPKHQFSFRIPRFAVPIPRSKPLVTTDLAKAAAYRDIGPIIYRPSTAECKAGCEGFWEWIWRRENTIVYVDEVTAVSGSVNPPDGYRRAIQMGRGKNIGVWSATQRPARVPVNLLSEAEHFMIFELRNPNDLKRMADYTDPIVARHPATGHDYWWYSTRDRIPVLRNAKGPKAR